MRAFIFSLDAFVAFTLAILAIYSLVFFSSVPSGYYGTLAQAHTLASDSLEALSLTRCNIGEPVVRACEDHPSLLEFLVLRDNPPARTSVVLGPLIPKSFGYRLEKKSGGDWDVIYDSANDPDERDRPKQPRKLSISAYRLVFEYTDPLPEQENPYTYRTCQGRFIPCGIPQSNFQPGIANVVVVKLTIYT